MSRLHLFEGFGIELEYMIVDRERLDVQPVADRLLAGIGGDNGIEVERGAFAWSNELALHVIEFKTNGPAASLKGLEEGFQGEVRHALGLLAELDATLLPSGMHPWMDPHTQLRLWPHENDVIYRTFDRIFDCRGHGWANLQSMHINLPFANDREFAALHAAIRPVLPLLPGLAASSPFADARLQPNLDSRLVAYGGNCRRVPAVAGKIIPERVFSRREYEEHLLARIYADLEPLDPKGVLRHEWVNARGAIARFDRMAIEIRLLDVQESPAADIAVAAAVVAVVQALAEGQWVSPRSLREWSEARLAATLADTIRDGGQCILTDTSLLEVFGFPERGAARAADLWQHLVETLVAPNDDYRHCLSPLEVIIREGTLAERLRAASGHPGQIERENLFAAYSRLARCLADGTVFR